MRLQECRVLSYYKTFKISEAILPKIVLIGNYELETTIDFPAIARQIVTFASFTKTIVHDMKKLYMICMALTMLLPLSAQDVIWEDNFDDGDATDWSFTDIDGDGVNWFVGNFGIGDLLV